MLIGNIVELTGRLLSRPLVLPGLLIGAAILGICSFRAASRFGWRKVPAVLAGLGAALLLAVTLSRSRPNLADMPGVFYYEEPFCLMNGFSVNGGFEFLNVLAFMPFAFFAVLATRRPLVVLAVSVVMSAVIELVQTLTGQGACETQDFFNNSLGAVVATALAAAVNVFLARVSSPVDADRVDSDATG
jgi:hypothetical protein